MTLTASKQRNPYPGLVHALWLSIHDLFPSRVVVPVDYVASRPPAIEDLLVHLWMDGERAVNPNVRVRDYEAYLERIDARNGELLSRPFVIFYKRRDDRPNTAVSGIKDHLAWYGNVLVVRQESQTVVTPVSLEEKEVQALADMVAASLSGGNIIQNASECAGLE
ncbi:hypothetical protein AURDEDRAFT_163051 [Auricularia subglabra TFB-10046 SS5]|nr:hypothetical protein AURDEDRAFT_163051 [Auricularia subglabra TFB-10046 SS5]